MSASEAEAELGADGLLRMVRSAARYSFGTSTFGRTYFFPTLQPAASAATVISTMNRFMMSVPLGRKLFRHRVRLAWRRSARSWLGLLPCQPVRQALNREVEHRDEEDAQRRRDRHTE